MILYAYNLYIHLSIDISFFDEALISSFEGLNRSGGES